MLPTIPPAEAEEPNPDPAPAAPPTLVEEQPRHSGDLQIAQNLLAGSRFDDAANRYMAIISIDAKCAEAWFGLGYARLLGTANLQTGFAEAQMAFLKARDYGSIEKLSFDLLICRALVDYYGRLAGTVKEIDQMMAAARTNAFCGIGLAALSAAVGGRHHTSYFNQTMGVIGTVSGIGLAASSVQVHGSAAQAKLFVRKHMTFVRDWTLGVYQADSARYNELNDGFTRINRIVFPELFVQRQPTPVVQKTPPPELSFDPRRLCCLKDKAVFFGLCAGIARRTGFSAVVVRLLPFVIIAGSLIAGMAAAYSHSQNSPNDRRFFSLPGLLIGVGFTFFASFLIGFIYLIVGACLPRLDGRLLRDAATNRLP